MRTPMEIRKVRFKPLSSFDPQTRVRNFDKTYELNGQAQVTTKVREIFIDLDDINWIRFGRDTSKYEE
jgi:hypothetical protein